MVTLKGCAVEEVLDVDSGSYAMYNYYNWMI